MQSSLPLQDCYGAQLTLGSVKLLGCSLHIATSVKVNVNLAQTDVFILDN